MNHPTNVHVTFNNVTFNNVTIAAQLEQPRRCSVTHISRAPKSLRLLRLLWVLLSLIPKPIDYGVANRAVGDASWEYNHPIDSHFVYALSCCLT